MLITYLKEVLEIRDLPPGRGDSGGSFRKTLGFIMVPVLTSSGTLQRFGVAGILPYLTQCINKMISESLNESQK